MTFSTAAKVMIRLSLTGTWNDFTFEFNAEGQLAVVGATEEDAVIAM